MYIILVSRLYREIIGLYIIHLHFTYYFFFYLIIKAKKKKNSNNISAENLKEKSQEFITIDLTQDSTTLIQEIPFTSTNKIVPPSKKEPSRFIS